MHKYAEKTHFNEWKHFTHCRCLTTPHKTALADGKHVYCARASILTDNISHWLFYWRILCIAKFNWIKVQWVTSWICNIFSFDNTMNCAVLNSIVRVYSSYIIWLYDVSGVVLCHRATIKYALCMRERVMSSHCWRICGPTESVYWWWWWWSLIHTVVDIEKFWFWRSSDRNR